MRMPNITLKRDAPFRGGFEGLLFFRLRWLRQSSVTGAPLSFTLGVAMRHPMLTQAAIDLISHLVATTPPPASIWLIGSRANGRINSKSDTDLLVFADRTFITNAASSIAAPVDIDVLVVYDGENFKDVWKEKRGSLKAFKWAQLSESCAQYVGRKFIPDDDEEDDLPQPVAGDDMQLGEFIEYNEKSIRVWPGDA